jgi:molecular chaperone GrpE (heat shock protein)
MRGWLSRLFGREPQAVSTHADGRLLEAERELQELRLEAQERERQADSVRADLERARQGEAIRVSEAVEVRIEQLLAQAATPAAQLMVQAHLLEAEGKPVEARDVLAVAKRLVTVLAEAGLAFEGAVGETAAYDPDRHEPLGGPALTLSQTVVVRVPGCSYGGRLLKRAGVDGAPEETR